MTANNLTNIALALTATQAGVASLLSQPALGDNSTKLASTASLFKEFTDSGQQVLNTTVGYQKLPGGMVLQWGNGNMVSGVLSPTFPVPFVDNCFIVIANATTPGIVAVGNAATKTGATIYGHVASTNVAHTGDVRWLAIGK